MSEDVARRLVDALYAGTQAPAGCRVNHARGLLAEGRFSPSGDAGALTRAATFAGPDQKVLARFSSSTGDPDIAQDDPHANPRGLAIRIGDTPGLVLVGHSVEAFPARDPAEFLAFLEALNGAAGHPERLDRHMREHDAARRFEAVRPGAPASFATICYHMLHPYRLTAEDGRSFVGRLSVAGGPGRADRAPTPAGSDYLDRELRARLSHRPVEFLLVFQPACDSDAVTDVSASWSGLGSVKVLGRVLIDRVAPDQAAQRSVVFDPAMLPDGVAFAGDPMIEARVAAYRLAARRRLGGQPSLDAKTQTE